MLNRSLIYIFIAALCGGLNYYVSLDIIISCVIFVVGLLVGFLFIEKFIVKFFDKETRTKECIQFINNFVITLSINKSTIDTFEICSKAFSKRLNDQVKLLNNLSVEEKIHYISKYFDSPLYRVFLNLLDQYEYNGGDILKISQILLFDAHRTEEDVENHKSILIRKLVEFITLWVITFIVLVLMKAALGDYFNQISELFFFKYGMAAFFLFFYINTSLFVMNGFNLSFIDVVKEPTLKERKKNNEKVKKQNKKGKQKS